MIRFDGLWVSMLNRSICFWAVEDDLTEVGKDLPGAYGAGADPEADDAYILMQFTGLHDENGKEIYEGDVMKDRFGAISQIVFVNELASYRQLSKIGYSPLSQNSIISGNDLVIGNIYENPNIIL
jgi:hypothetical protein